MDVKLDTLATSRKLEASGMPGPQAGAVVEIVNDAMTDFVTKEYLTIELDRSFSEFERKIDRKLDERFDKVDEKFDKIDEKFDKIDEKFEMMGGKFDKLAYKVHIIRKIRSIAPCHKKGPGRHDHGRASGCAGIRLLNRLLLYPHRIH